MSAPCNCDDTKKKLNWLDLESVHARMECLEMMVGDMAREIAILQTADRGVPITYALGKVVKPK